MCLSPGFPPGFTVSGPLRGSIDLSTYTLIIGRKQRLQEWMDGGTHLYTEKN